MDVGVGVGVGVVRMIDALNGVLAKTGPSTSTVFGASLLLDAFRTSTTHSPWKLDRAEVADRLEELIRDPELVSQGKVGSCGAAAFLRHWIQEDPLGFAGLAASLFDTGSGELGSMRIAPDSDLVGHTWDPAWDVPAADWMVMSSMLDSANFFLDFEGTPDETQATGSSVLSMQRWFEATGHTVTVLDKYRSATELHALRPDPGRHVVLNIHSSLLGVNRGVGTPKNEPNHWVGLAAAIAAWPHNSSLLTVWEHGRTWKVATLDYHLEDKTFEVVVAEH